MKGPAKKPAKAKFEPADLASAVISYLADGDFTTWFEHLDALQVETLALSESDLLELVEYFAQADARKLLGMKCYQYVYGEDPPWGAPPEPDEGTPDALGG